MVPRGEYEQLMPEQRQLLVAIGHELDAPVHVTRRTEAYEIVEPWNGLRQGVQRPPLQDA